MASPNAAQLAETAFIDGLNADGTVAAQSFADWTAGSSPATYGAATDHERKWDNGATGARLAVTAKAGVGGGTVTYAFNPAATIVAAQQAAFVAALTLWSDEANIAFAPAPSTTVPDVLLSVTAGGSTYEQGASAAYATVGSAAIPAEDGASGEATIVFNNSGAYGLLGSFTVAAGYGVAALVHEVGHLLGLGHAGPYNDGSGVSQDVAQLGAYDSRQWSAMSYISPDDRSAKYYGSYAVKGANWQVATTSGRITTYAEAAPDTPMPLDILAAQQLYGAPVRTTLSGGQVFGFNCNITDAARPFFDFTQDVTPVVTLWDAGTGNVLDLSGFSAPSTVNLNPGTFSSAAGLVDNIGIAFGTSINTAVGGAGNDTFVLNNDSDTVNGGGGTNTAVLPGGRTQYSVLTSGSTRILKAVGITEKLTNIQVLAFGDGAVSVAATSPDPLFDPAFYLVSNPDVAAAGADPYQHYMAYGWKEGRDPSALFSERWYLNQNPDVAAAGVNPLLHFESSGWREGRDPSSLFSLNAYLSNNPDIARAGVDPLLQYYTNGALEGRATYAAQPHATAPQDPLVSAAFVYAARPDVLAAGLDATTWFHAYGWKEGTPPDALFDVSYYLRQNPDVLAAHADPVIQYEQYGWHEGRNPSAAFNGNAYLAHNPDVAAAGIDPLVHYLAYGQAEGRATYPA